MNAQFSTMQYDNRHLVIKTTNGKPVVVAECYLPDVSAQICELLTNAAENQTTLETQKKEQIEK